MSKPGMKKVAAVLRQSVPSSKKGVAKRSGTDLAPEAASLALDIGRMIESARNQVGQTVNAALTTLYWQVGTRLRQDVLKESRARYGGEIVAELGRGARAKHHPALHAAS